MIWKRFKKSYEPWGFQIPRVGVTVTIPTREGEVQAGPGDYILFDSEGYPYPIAEEELENVYDVVETAKTPEDDR